MIEEGDTVPKFTINDSNGNKVKSTDFKGGKHVIYFYPKDFTPGCSTQADEFSSEYNKFKKNEIEIGLNQILHSVLGGNALTSQEIEFIKKFIG